VSFCETSVQPRGKPTVANASANQFAQATLRANQFAQTTSSANKFAQTTPTSAKNSHVAVLDGLRGIAIAGVVWYHAWLVSKVPSLLSIGGWKVNLEPLARAGFMGVDLFFFVSGFCLFYPYARHLLDGKAAPTALDFAVRRIKKIVPSYLVALLAFSFLHRSWFASTSQWLWNIAAHLTFIHPLFSNTFGSISGPFWTLGIEVEFYLLFPLICWAVRRKPLLAFLGLCAIANVYRLLVAHFGDNTLLYPVSQLPAVIDIFGAGMLAAYAIVYFGRYQIRRRARLAATVLAAWGFVALFFLLRQLGDISAAAGDGHQYPWVNAHRSEFAALFLVCGVCSAIALPAWRNVVAHPALVYLAGISYNLYLWHLEIIVWYDAHVAPLVQRVLAWPGVAQLLVPPLLSIFAAAIVTRVVEKPFLRGGWRPMAARASALGRGLFDRLDLAFANVGSVIAP
jgi:peptidoglycan/LPS O-acetylase OafA/YrhL